MSDNKKVLFVVASQGYQPIEYGIPKQILESAEYEVITASDKVGIAIGKDQSTTKVDLALEDIMIKDYDALFFIGGPGAEKYLDNETSYQLLQAWQKSGKPFGAICYSTRILAHAGVLKGVKATGWNGDSELPHILQSYGAIYDGSTCVRDGYVVTAEGPLSAKEFGETISKLFV